MITRVIKSLKRGASREVESSMLDDILTIVGLAVVSIMLVSLGVMAVYFINFVTGV